MNTTTAFSESIQALRDERDAILAEADAEGLDIRAAGNLNPEYLRESLAQAREARDYQPQVGDGMTMLYPQDAYPYVITRVSASGKTAWVKPLELVSKATGHEPARFEGPFPIWSHTYAAEERQTMVRDLPEIRVNRSRDGLRWSAGATPFVREAHYHRNFSY